MPDTIYKTEDGQTFQYESDAQNHANNLAANDKMHRDRAATATRRNDEEKYAYYKKVEAAFNAGNWDMVIKADEEGNNKYKGWVTGQFHSVYPIAYSMSIIAHAYRDGDYGEAFVLSGWVWGGKSASEEKWNIIYKKAFEAGKKAWEKKFGRIMTTEDLPKIKADYSNDVKQKNIIRWEESIVSYINQFKSNERIYTKKLDKSRELWAEVDVDVTAEKKQEFLKCIWVDVSYWEEATGKKMTKEEQIRISGSPFPKKSSSSSSSSSDQRNGFVSFIFVLVCGVGGFFGSIWIIVKTFGEMNSNLVFLGVLAVGIIFAVIAGKAWKNKKNILFIVMFLLSIYGWLYILGLNPDNTKWNDDGKIKTSTEQTVEE